MIMYLYDWIEIDYVELYLLLLYFFFSKNMNQNDPVSSFFSFW